MSSQSFYPMFYTIIAQIPAGKVMSYGDVAKAAGLPSHARWVGKALAALPEESSVPWHRVLKADGSLAFPIGSAAFRRQSRRLQQEGVKLNQGRCVMTRYRWLNE